MEVQFIVLPASHGDSILIKGPFDGQNRNILIDGGPSSAYEYRRRPKELKKTLEQIKDDGERVDLLVLSHVDDDHVGGLLAGFKNGGLLEELTDMVWFNSGKLIFEHFDKNYDQRNSIEFEATNTDEDSFNLTSIRQGVKFEEYISGLGIWKEEIVQAGMLIELFDVKFKILSPSPEKLEKLMTKWEEEDPDSLTAGHGNDYDKSIDELLENDMFSEESSVHNGSSIAFIFEYDGKRILLLGDAHNDVIIESIKDLGHSPLDPLKVDYVKLSHHGSKYNTSPELLKLISCNNFIVSTDGRKHGLPNKLTLARIIDEYEGVNIFFNYPGIIKDKIFSAEELSELEIQGVDLKSCEQPFQL